MGERNGTERRAWPITDVVELRGAPLVDGVTWRRALVYPIGGVAANGWRLRIELFPQHNEAGTGWFGGRVIWGCDGPDRDAVEVHARRWVDDGLIP